MQSRFEQSRITQLISLYSPDDPPRVPLDFGDYLSLLWRIDGSAAQPNRERYYRQCAQALGKALGPKNHALYRLVDSTEAGNIYSQIPNLPYRSGSRFVDAQDRKSALSQLMVLRSDTLRVGTYSDNWGGGWPGSGMLDNDLRERVFAVLFTALQGQYSNFGRLLLVIDIVIANLIFGFDEPSEVPFAQLTAEFGYPDPRDERVRRDFSTLPQT
ncbi:MAG: hypothetical protein IT319_08440 [Anaerolineae bacterium]|nr:hypothetical protein [Anaerolineae bacterium]